eukprot:9045029-Pyramimonas_sp.AAC.1
MERSMEKVMLCNGTCTTKSTLVRATSWSGCTRCAWALRPKLEILAQAGNVGFLRPSALW